MVNFLKLNLTELLYLLGFYYLYSEIIMRDFMDLEGNKFGGRNINNIRCADDTSLVADSEEKLQALVQVSI